MAPAEKKLVAALKDPLLAAMDVSEALEAWLNGRDAAHNGDTAAATDCWNTGLAKLRGLERLPAADWGPLPDATLTRLQEFTVNDTAGTTLQIVSWPVDSLTQYGVLVLPRRADSETPLPLLLYLHGAAYGVPVHALPWLAGMARQGYAIIAPALRGEPLFAGTSQIPESMRYQCEGGIENLDGEVDDALAAVAAARKLPGIRSDGFAVIGHSFGAGVGLLVSARAPDVACTVSYDAWLTNPFRYYWDRMRRGPNNWLSWAEFARQPAAAQLHGLMRRSVLHHADLLRAPLLLFIGGGYAGSVFHRSHEELTAALRQADKPFTYDVVPNGGHNFVLYYSSEPARYAYRRHMRFLREHWPPAATGRDPDPDPQDRDASATTDND